MSHQSKERQRHDRINLNRLIRHLETTVTKENWLSSDPPNSQAELTKTTSAQTTLNYARMLLHEIQKHQDMPATSMSLDTMERKLDELEGIVSDAKATFQSTPRKRGSILGGIRRPRGHKHLPSNIEAVPIYTSPPEAELLPAEEPVGLSPQRQNLHIGLPEPPPYQHAEGTMGGSSPPTLSSGLPKEPPAFLATSLQTQEELSLQLSQMAAQLKLNALHFSESLNKEKTVIEDAEAKLGRNLGKMKGERVRLRDHSGKSGGTTWMVLGAVCIVIVAWVMMFFIIRLT